MRAIALDEVSIIQARELKLQGHERTINKINRGSIPDGELVGNPYPLGCVPSWLWLDRGGEPAQVCHLRQPTQSLLVAAVRWVRAQGAD